MTQLDLLVVVPAFNEERFVKGCLDSISENLDTLKINYRVIVVDNGSSDKTGFLAEQCGATVLKLERSSVSHARNLGAAYCDSKFIAFIDADVLVTPGWGEALERLLESMIPSQVLTGCQYSIRDDAGWIEKYWFSNLRDKHLNGGNIIVSRSAFESVRGFDERLKTGEDYDFCIRAQSRSVTYRVDEAFRAIHLGYPRDLSAFIRRELWHGEGDFRSLASFIKSPVAILGVGYFFAVLAIGGLLFAGKYLTAFAVLVLFLVGNLMLTFMRFPRCNGCVVAVNSVINLVYFFTRALSLCRALVNKTKKY